MRDGWSLAPIGDVSTIVNGGTPKIGTVEYWNGDVLWITPKDMGKLRSVYVSDTSRKISQIGLSKSSAKLIPENSIILSTRAPIGHLAINQAPMATNQGCRGLIPKPQLGTKFLFYFLKLNVPLLNELGTGTTFKELSKGALAAVQIPIPAIPEQQRIVAILDEALEGVDVAVANAEKNLANVRELFESYLNNVFTQMGMAWELVKLSDLTTDITDGDHSPPPKSTSGIPFITISNINKRTNQIDFSDTFKVPEKYFQNLKFNKRPRIGDVLYTVTGSFGIPVMVRKKKDFCFQRHIGLIRPKDDVDSSWLYYLLMSPSVFRQASGGATGTAQKTVSLKVLRNIVVPKITLSEQKNAVVKLDEISAAKQRLEAIYEQKLDDLAELKQSFLQKAFNGELTQSSNKSAAA